MLDPEVNLKFRTLKLQQRLGKFVYLAANGTFVLIKAVLTEKKNK